MGTTLRAAVAIPAILLFTFVSDATAQTVFCSVNWVTACASVTTSVVEVVEGGEFSDKTAVGNYVLVISVANVSFNPDPLPDPNLDVESGVIRQLLMLVTDGAGEPRAPTDDFWVTDENGNDWLEWNLSKDEEFKKLSIDFTQDATNETGSCRGIVTDVNAPNLPCGPNGDFHTLAVFHLVFDVIPLDLENFAVQFVNLNASSCGDDPYCESDWAVIPEPVTVILLGTGLVGVGMARLRRRRRGLDIVED